jgi:hypothetical protein
VAKYCSEPLGFDERIEQIGKQARRENASQPGHSTFDRCGALRGPAAMFLSGSRIASEMFGRPILSIITVSSFCLVQAFADGSFMKERIKLVPNSVSNVSNSYKDEGKTPL